MIKLVAFDWNGTLLADTEANVRASNINFKKYGLKPIDLLKFQKTFQIPISSFWTDNGGKIKDLPEQSLNFHELYEKEANFCRSRKGSKLLLNWLKHNNINSVIYSNHIAPEIVKQLLRLNTHECFKEVLARPAGDHSHVKLRSKETKLADYVKSLKLQPQEILTIGDTEEEIEIGKKYGYYTAGITGGYNTTARLKKHSPDFLIHNLKDLIPIIKKLNQ